MDRSRGADERAEDESLAKAAVESTLALSHRSFTDRSERPAKASHSPRLVELSDLPTTIPRGGQFSFSVSGLDLTSPGGPRNIRMAVNADGYRFVQLPVAGGLPKFPPCCPNHWSPGPHILTLRAKPSGTLVTVPFTVVEP